MDAINIQTLFSSNLASIATMALKLYGNARFTCTRRARTVLEEKGLEFELSPVDPLAGANRTEEHANEFHPFQNIPVLIDTETGVKFYGR